MQRVWTSVLFVAVAMVLSAQAAEEKKDEKKGESWKGTVEADKDGVPTLTVKDQTFLLKASEHPGEDVAAHLAKIGKGEMKGDVKVTGKIAEADGKKWILVDKISAAGEKKTGDAEHKTKEKKEKDEK